ncbi:MAG: hypothetical protein WC516_06560 [Patescibacteria group bacterium]|jgi:hypothetical protein
MIEKYTRTPYFEIEVRRPRYNIATYRDDLIVVFGVSNSKGMSTACIAYSFNESLSSPDTDFSITLTLEKDLNGNTWYDKIKVRDLVFIKTHGSTKFVGYVTDRRLSARMAEGPQREITISGKNLCGLLINFSIILDQHILSASTTAQSASKQFMADVAGKVEVNQTLSELMKKIVVSYFNLMDEIGGTQNIGIRQIIEHFFDYTSKFSNRIVAKYPMAISLYQTGENSLWEVLQSMITPPFHEFFCKWDSVNSKYQVNLRPTPFDAVDWKNLSITYIPENIPALLVQDYSIGDSDSETKTFFGTFLPGSAYSKEKVLTLEDFAYTVKKDYEKWPYYGYKPLFVEMQYYNRNPANDVSFTGAASLMNVLSTQLFDWFKNNALFLTGSITIMDVKNADYTYYPNIGERIGFLGGEFYIEDVQRSWRYGGSMTATLGISRGFTYNKDGSQMQPIENVGQKLGMLEVVNG